MTTPLQKGDSELRAAHYSQPRSGHQMQQQPSAAMVDISPTPPAESKRTTRSVVQTPQTNTNPLATTPSVTKRLGAKALQAPQKGRPPTGTSSNYSIKSGGSEELKTYGMPNEPMVNPFVIGATPMVMPTGAEFEPPAVGMFVPSEVPPVPTAAPVKTLSSVGKGPSPASVLARTANSPKDIMSLLKQIAVAYYSLCVYKCSESIALFKKLPKQQYNTGWTLCQVGRALFESIRYSEAEKVFAEALRVEPYRLEGIEYYSTCLWHLRKQVDLCSIANYALEKSLFAPETWCAVGNCFSLQKEHETALKFFNRAIQLNPYFPYAHTLCGHEYVANEDFEQARKCYQRALSADDKHYNAWWGLGNIYLKQEKYDHAIQYFKTAIKINPRSSVLVTYLGMTYFHNRQPREALECFEAAEKMDPNNPLNRYQKATVLMSMNQLDRALAVLEELNVRVPREAPIHILIGKIYKRLGNKDKALAHYNIAMDLDPKEANMVKSLIDKLDRENDVNEENDL